MAESGYSAVGIIIPGYSVPAGKTVVGTQLDHSEGSRVTGIICPYEWIYFRSQILFGVILGVTRGVSGHEERYSQ